jgi:GST-like protein
MPESYRLLGCRACGSFIVEAAFRLADIPYEYEEVDYNEPGPARDRLFALNPLGQVPTLILPNGDVMTESAAIVLMVDDQEPAAGLAPEPGSAERVVFLRWLVFLVAAIYPTFTYGDSPEKWLPGSADAQALREATNRHRERLWRHVEAAVDPQPWFLGRRFSALDIYVGAMTHWRPRQEWFARECPKLSGVAAEVERLPALAPLFAAHFSSPQP